MKLKLGPDGESLKMLVVLIVNLRGLAVSQLNNYYNWPDAGTPQVKTEVREAGRETRIKCQVRERYRHIQNGLHLSWDYKPCQVGNVGACMEAGAWTRLCGPRCPPTYTLLEPRIEDSGLYRCHITIEGSLITLNIYMLQFNDNRRRPPVIVGGMEANVTVVAPQLASLHCKVSSSTPPIIRWFRRHQTINPLQTRHNSSSTSTTLTSY